MPLRGLQAALHEGLTSVYVLVGDEGLLVRRAEALAEGRALDGVMAAFNHAVFRAGDEGSADALSVARTLPMMSARRVITLRDIHEAPPTLMENLLEYCQDPSPTTVLIITGSAWPKASGGTDWGRRLENKVKKSGYVLRLRSKDQDPVAFAQATADELGCRLARDDARMLVDMVGKDLGRIRRELEKAALFLGGSGEISAQVLEKVCSLLAEAEIWSLTDAVMARDADRALATAHRLLEAGKRGEAHRLVAMVSWQLRQLLTLQQSLDAGEGGQGVRMPRWKLKAAGEALRRAPLDPARVLERLARANQAMNSHRAGDRRVFEGLLLDLLTGLSAPMDQGARR